MIEGSVIAVNLNTRRIYISELTGRNDHERFLAITQLWERSRLFEGDPPIIYSYQTDELTLFDGWHIS